ncbi:ORF5 [Agrotis segetum granulovirus]|uniref:ORF5 n=1 Tax=Agrotis segetum granulosis virus TaxID=10464 RepID=Q6QXC4_GVAS|nr:hypothetical protein AsGV005 [Agrotis segetum granulovirus]AAS82733.1 ORF5 [Agrotis segetum granulovirus]AHN92043.1 hypothetical protein AsGV004 [Agrotis segetum granulovirus]AKN63279.1 hypothetical protein AsGV005 [Agrotis segetum granulovirus]
MTYVCMTQLTRVYIYQGFNNKKLVCTAMDLKTLLLFQWNTPPTKNVPRRYEYTPSRVYYSFGKHHRIYDHWYSCVKSVFTLSQETRDFLQVFNNRAQRDDWSYIEVRKLLRDVDYKEIEECYCLWAYVTKDGMPGCERVMEKIIEDCASGLVFVTDECVTQETDKYLWY